MTLTIMTEAPFGHGNGSFAVWNFRGQSSDPLERHSIEHDNAPFCTKFYTQHHPVGAPTFG